MAPASLSTAAKTASRPGRGFARGRGGHRRVQGAAQDKPGLVHRAHLGVGLVFNACLAECHLYLRVFSRGPVALQPGPPPWVINPSLQALFSRTGTAVRNGLPAGPPNSEGRVPYTMVRNAPFRCSAGGRQLQCVGVDQAAWADLIASMTRSVTSSMPPMPSTWVRMPRSAYLATTGSVCSWYRSSR